MNTALVTGPIDHTDFVALALKREGFDVLAWENATPEAVDGPASGSVECYVQLPAEPAPTGPLVHRLETVAAVAPLLGPDAVVLLVTDEPGWDVARRHALWALAEAAVTERAGPGRRVAVVDSDAVGDIAVVARRELAEAKRVSLADLGSGLAHADWRNEVMNLTSTARTSYFGWRRPDGARRAAVLRRSVLSPLTAADDGDHALARAVLTDALGPSALGDLQQSDGGLTEDFLREVIGPLPTDEFELPIHAVATWVIRRSLSEGQSALGLRTVPAGSRSGEDHSGS